MEIMSHLLPLLPPAPHAGNSITPGTLFMLDISLSLISWACSRLVSARWVPCMEQVCHECGFGARGEHITCYIPPSPTRSHTILLTHACMYACTPSCRYADLQIEVSDGTVRGEGEVKILGRIAHPWYASMASGDTHGEGEGFWGF